MSIITTGGRRREKCIIDDVSVGSGLWVHAWPKNFKEGGSKRKQLLLYLGNDVIGFINLDLHFLQFKHKINSFNGSYSVLYIDLK